MGGRGGRSTRLLLPPPLMDPLVYLSWDCAALIMQHLDITDLARCERVSKNWGKYVYEWMAAAGANSYFTGRYKSEGTLGLTKQQKVDAFKRTGRIGPLRMQQVSIANAITHDRYEAHG